MASPPRSIQELTEDLTVQQVILSSLEAASFEGVEEERREARKEIDRIKGLLRQAKKSQTPPATNRNVEPRVSTEEEADQNQDQAASTPSAQRRRPSPITDTMSTPRGADIWRQPSSHSLPSRKRGLDAAHLDARIENNKSRRTTPTPTVPHEPFEPSSSGGRSRASNGEIEFIDLTGDDNDYDHEILASQRRAEQRREQERRDHEYAQMLSAQETPPQAPATQQFDNAFARLMSSQLPSGPDSDPISSDAEAFRLEPDANPVPRADVLPMNMPGAFPILDDPFNPGPSRNIWTPVSGHSSNSYGPRSSLNGLSSLSAHGPVAPAFYVPQPSHTLPNSSTPSFVPMTSSGAWDALDGFGRNPTTPVPLGRGNSSLDDIILRTSMFGYASGMDGSGNPLPERVANIFRDEHDPMTDKDLDNLLQNIRPDLDIPEQNYDGTPAGLKRPLYPHQELALTWMKKMEEGTNKGGILADDMGLGKTISTLALILSRPATRRPKTNLIIGPVALIRQWEEEILSKTKLSHRLSVFVYHNRKATTDDLLKYDVVLTTYGTIAQELKRLEKYLEENGDRNVDFEDRDLLFRCPLLHPDKAKFYRVILDEAQCIKNKGTRTAMACFKLKTTYRWCLTGTPMMNGVLELYSLLHFLQIKPYSIWEQFRQSFGVLFGRNGDPKSVAMKRLRALLKAIMLRRKKNSQLNGQPILQLPIKTEEVVYAELSVEERDFYTQLERKSQVQFSKYLRDGSIGKNYSNILVLLLRMRQACCHPHLNLDVDDAIPTMTDEEAQLKLIKALDRAIVERIKSAEAFECPICYDAVQCPSFFVPCGHDSCSECLCRLAESAAALNLQEGSESSKAKCPVCRHPFEPSRCFTYDAFKKVHMSSAVVKSEPGEADGDDDSSSTEEDSDDDFISDDEVDSRGNLRGFIVNDDDSSEDKKLAMKTKKAKKTKKGKKKASDIKPSMLKTLRMEAYKNREAFKKYMRYMRKTWMPAAKVTECMRMLKDIQQTGEKTIVFSQWTLLLDLLEVAMWHDKFPRKPVRYDGSMTATERNSAAHSFRDKPDVMVMLVSLRAGNAGLNLTAASRVIIMDPFWNPYIEMQAVDRAYRIGQQKEVKVYRILTKETVEDRIVALQNKKKEIVEAALDEAESAKIGRLGVSELKFLFNAR